MLIMTKTNIWPITKLRPYGHVTIRGFRSSAQAINPLSAVGLSRRRLQKLRDERRTRVYLEGLLAGNFIRRTMIYDVNSPLFRSFLSQKGGASDKRFVFFLSQWARWFVFRFCFENWKNRGLEAFVFYEILLLMFLCVLNMFASSNIGVMW